MNRFRSPYVAILSLVALQSILTMSTISPTLLKQFNILINLAVVVNLIPYLLAMFSVPALQKAEHLTGLKAKITNFSALCGAIYSLYAVYGCGWEIISDGLIVMILGIVIYMAKTYRIHPAADLATYPPFHIHKK